MQFSRFSLPTKPGVYLFKNKNGTVIYVGKAKDLKARVTNYFSNKYLDTKTIKLVSDITDLETIQVASEIEAFLLEASLIKKFQPFYNIQLRDDKYFPYIKIGKSPHPYVVIARNKNDTDAIYFGPYVSSNDVKVVLKILRRIFPFHSVKNHQKRTCLYYHLNLCPCVSVHKENTLEYKKNIKRLATFLSGKKENVLKQLQKEQQLAVKSEQFEMAAMIQKKIESIEYITSDVYSPFRYIQKPDFYFERISQELDSLKELLHANYIEVTSLERIECYDISNISGKEATGSMVVFKNGDAATSEYRRFKIRSKNTPDDYAMHQEVMRRRLKNTQWPCPNLIVIDGGKGQVSSVLSVLLEKKVSIPLIGLAKRIETIVIPYETLPGKYEYREVNLSLDTPGLNLLRRLRDEAHRFALSYHRLLRKKLITALV